MVKIEGLTGKPRASGGSKGCATWKSEKAVSFFTIIIIIIIPFNVKVITKDLRILTQTN